jgi:hypothetical protein
MSLGSGSSIMGARFSFSFFPRTNSTIGIIYIVVEGRLTGKGETNEDHPGKQWDFGVT